MFEKEAEEILNKYCDCEFLSECIEGIRCRCSVYEERKKMLFEGIKFGYNKANEWHYVKDVNCYEDLHFPPEEEEKGRVLIWKVQVITEKGIRQPVCYHSGSYGDLWYEMNAYHVIAWKEIVLPELKESE